MGASDIVRRGLMLVLSSPSGAGKTTITRKLLEPLVDQWLQISVSVTTRPMRPGEKDGRDYHFVAADEFGRLLRNGDPPGFCPGLTDLNGCFQHPFDFLGSQENLSSFGILFYAGKTQ